MKPAGIIGIILIVIGILALVYGGITYTKREKVLDLGPIQATAASVWSAESFWSSSAIEKRRARCCSRLAASRRP
jgi:hypothetical protein